jgi:hypothetical protein
LISNTNANQIALLCLDTELFDVLSSCHIWLGSKFSKNLNSLITKDKYNESANLLDFIVTKFNKSLNSFEWEQCGDFYYQIDRKESAERAYLKASEMLGN